MPAYVEGGVLPGERQHPGGNGLRPAEDRMCGVEKAKDRHHGDCPSLLRSTFSPDSKGDGDWKRGYEDGQRLAWNLELLRRLKDCFLPIP